MVSSFQYNDFFSFNSTNPRNGQLRDCKAGNRWNKPQVAEISPSAGTIWVPNQPYLHACMYIYIYTHTVYFAVVSATMAHPNQKTRCELGSEKSVHEYAFFLNSLVWCNSGQSRYFSTCFSYRCQRYDHQKLNFYQILT